MPTRCPACNDELHVTGLQCPSCATRIEGDYPLDRLLTLDAEMRRFLWEFLRQRGNLRALEPVIGQSYPTLRKTYDRLLTALGLDAVPTGSTTDVIMEDLRAGRITADEATRKLQALARG